MRRKKTEVRQQQIVEAAQRLIFKYGSEHLTVRRISREVGISQAAIYRHFKSKKSILSFLVSHIENILLSEISRESIGDEAVTLETIERTVRNHFSNLNSRKGMAFQVIAEIISLGDKSLNRQASSMIHAYVSRIQELLEEGVKGGHVREDIDLNAAATLLFNMIQSLVSIWALNNCSFDLLEKYASLWKVYRESIARR